jgi:glutaredoxin 3
MKVELYTWSYCPFCVAALELLDSRGIEYENHVMDAEPEELERVKQRHAHGTVPIILIDGEFIGGNDSLKALDAEGKLVAS